MSNHDSIPTLTPDLVLEQYAGYPEEVLESEWNPALNQVLRLRQHKQKRAIAQPLSAKQPDLPK
jgi:hypothetical protein